MDRRGDDDRQDARRWDRVDGGGRVALVEPTPLVTRILDGTLRCVGRWGVAKTTLDDIAREAGCSRATIYRAFPGGKTSVLLAAGEAEVRRLLDALAAELETADDLETLLTVGMAELIGAVRTHEALQYLLAHEPGTVLTHLSFDALDPLLSMATEFGAPYLERYLPPADAAAAAEWIARLVVSYAVEPAHADLAQRANARRFVCTYVLPGLRPMMLPGTAA
jgi:AcrR family transcriptional regulator